MTTIAHKNIKYTTNDWLSKLTIIRYKCSVTKNSKSSVVIKKDPEFQKSGLRTLTASIALIVFSNFLNPFSGVFLLSGSFLLTISAISTFREILSSSTNNNIGSLTGKKMISLMKKKKNIDNQSITHP